jgi:glyoxylase-like metal-dependent hydrolase (beta-lactamase superfamily II)
MRTHLAMLSCVAALVGSASTASAKSKLQYKVFTGSLEGFLVNSTLIYGAKDAVLIDGMFTIGDAKTVAAGIKATKKNLTTVYVTHFHPDHYFGLVVIRKEFPKARIVALPSAVADIKRTWKEKVDQWSGMYKDNIPSEPIIPEELKGDSITLEGEKLQVTGELQGDAMDNSYVWVPALKLVVTGDIVYNGVFPWTAESTPATRKAWKASVDKIAALKPEIVVPGHQKRDAKDDAASLAFMGTYLAAYDDALAASKTSEELQAKVKQKFPDLALVVILKIGADAAFPPAKR